MSLNKSEAVKQYSSQHHAVALPGAWQNPPGFLCTARGFTCCLSILCLPHFAQKHSYVRNCHGLLSKTDLQTAMPLQPRHCTTAHISTFPFQQCWLYSVQVKVDDDSEWVAEGQQTGCTVLAEGDPLPSAHFGHMSFSSFNPELQKLQVSNAMTHHCPCACSPLISGGI